jgi:hypothetical protein
MAANSALMVVSDGQAPDALRAALDTDPDPVATEELLRRTFPVARIASGQAGETLTNGLRAGTETAYAAAHPGLEVVCTRRLWDDRPDLSAVSRGRRAVLVLTSPATDWLTFASWTDGEVVRAVSVSGRRGVVQNIGAPLPFEPPGTPAPAVLGEAALRGLAGIGGAVDADRIRLLGFQITGRTRAERAAFEAAYERSLADWASSSPRRFRFGPDGRLLP